jgi:hypothetical protein
MLHNVTFCYVLRDFCKWMLTRWLIDINNLTRKSYGVVGAVFATARRGPGCNICGWRDCGRAGS